MSNSRKKNKSKLVSQFKKKKNLKNQNEKVKKPKLKLLKPTNLKMKVYSNLKRLKTLKLKFQLHQKITKTKIKTADLPQLKNLKHFTNC